MKVTTRMNGNGRMSSANGIISAIKMKSTAKPRGITGMRRDEWRYQDAGMNIAAEMRRDARHQDEGMSGNAKM